MEKHKRFFAIKSKHQLKRQKMCISEDASKDLEETEADVSDPPGQADEIHATAKPPPPCTT